MFRVLLRSALADAVYAKTPTRTSTIDTTIAVLATAIPTVVPVLSESTVAPARGEKYFI